MLTLMISAVIFTVFRFQLFAFRGQEVQLDTQQSARNVMDLMTREIRLVGYDPSCAKSFDGIADARPQLLQVQFDSNADCAIGTGESVIYTYDSTLGTIQRSAGDTPVSLVEGMPGTALSFAYYDGTGTDLAPSGTPPALTPAQRTAVRRVKITLMLQQPNPDPHSSSPMLSRLVSNVELRNR